MHFLVGQSGPLAGRRFELGDEVILGRENATITLADEQTSRRHAAIRVVAGAVVLEDLGSTNGTFVDDRRIDSATTLTGGETIRLGQATFAVEIEVAPEPAADAGATRLAKRPEPVADPERTTLRPRPPAPAPPADPERTTLRSRAEAPQRVPAEPTPANPSPPPAAPAPAIAPAAASAPAPAAARAATELPFGRFSPPPAPRRRRGAATRKLGPTIVSFATIIATAVALIVYFAGR